MINPWKCIGLPRRDYEVISAGHYHFLIDRLRPLTSMMSTTMRRQWRHSAILREESFIVRNGVFEEYIAGVSAKEIYTEIKLMSCDDLNLLMPDFLRTMLS